SRRGPLLRCGNRRPHQQQRQHNCGTAHTNLLRRQNAVATRTVRATLVVAQGRHKTCPYGIESRKPNTHSESPEMVATYCLPSTSYVIGPLTICDPRLAFHSRSPVRASSA